jgi:hypothetical protein
MTLSEKDPSPWIYETSALCEKLTELAHVSPPNAAIVLNILNGALTEGRERELAELCLDFGMQVLD